MKLSTARRIKHRVMVWCDQHDLSVIQPSKSDRTILVMNFEQHPAKVMAEGKTWLEVSQQLATLRAS